MIGVSRPSADYNQSTRGVLKFGQNIALASSRAKTQLDGICLNGAKANEANVYVALL
jgi:hypothetical protein